MNKIKGSFNYKDIETKENFTKKVSLSGKTVTTVLNELIINYIHNSSTYQNNMDLKISIRKMWLMLETDEINREALKREVQRLWNMVQF